MGKEHIALLVSKNSPYASQKSVALADMANESFILNPVGSLRNIVDSMFQEAGFSPNLYMENQSYIQIQEMVARGVGITLAPVVTWASDSRDDLAYVPLSDVNRTRYLYLRVPENAPTSPKVDALKQFLIDYFAEKCQD